MNAFELAPVGLVRTPPMKILVLTLYLCLSEDPVVKPQDKVVVQNSEMSKVKLPQTGLWGKRSFQFKAGDFCIPLQDSTYSLIPKTK